MARYTKPYDLPGYSNDELKIILKALKTTSAPDLVLKIKKHISERNRLTRNYENAKKKLFD